MKKCLLIAAAAVLALAALPAAACKKKTKEEGISRYEITAAYDAEKCSLSGKTDFTFYNSTGNEIHDLSFNLWGNAYRKDALYKPLSENEKQAYYAGESYGAMSVEKVEGCASWEVTGEDQNILSVALGDAVYPEQTVQVSITYTLDLAKVNHRTGVTKSTVNLGNFYPVLCAYTSQGFLEAPYYQGGDPFVSECADYDVTFTLPRGYAAATSGKEVSKSESGEVVNTRYELKRARDFAAVLSDKFKTVERQSAGCDVTVYYCGEKEPVRAADAVCESLQYFSDTFGAYPYPTLSVVYTPLSVSGMEYPALTMISDSLNEAEAIYTVVHENAHQWWYAAVGNDQVNCAWQDEGLAEYSSLCFFETHPAYGYTRTAILDGAVKAYRAYFSVYNQIFGEANTKMTRCLKDFASDYEYANIAYNKGLLMFESVRSSMGDEKFFDSLREYYEDNKFKIASAEDLIAPFASRHDVEGLFNSYIEGNVII